MDHRRRRTSRAFTPAGITSSTCVPRSRCATRSKFDALKRQFLTGSTLAQSLRTFPDVFVTRHADLFEKVEFLGDPLVSAAHHSDGCRMAARPADGVVDRDLRVFGARNLYVADGSVLPYSGHANTGLTIAALALKCADAIRSPVSLHAPA